MPPADDSFVEIGKVVRPHGVQGELRVQLYNPDSEVLFEVDKVHALLPDGSDREIKIDSVRAASAGIVLLTLEGVAGRDAAETMRGVVLSVPRTTLPAPGEGEFYVCDVIGAHVFLQDGTEVGKVVDYRAYPTTEVLLIQGESKRYEVPLVADFVDSVDARAGRVVLLSIDGFESE
ncbi:MAG: 16S rRNA processing protein RimM [Deltaproteobacteria bacterium]|nr:16S rRNA processing protein RimM [Deltaproteobacteria bacterium]